MKINYQDLNVSKFLKGILMETDVSCFTVFETWLEILTTRIALLIHTHLSHHYQDGKEAEGRHSRSWKILGTGKLGSMSGHMLLSIQGEEWASDAVQRYACTG